MTLYAKEIEIPNLSAKLIFPLPFILLCILSVFANYQKYETGYCCFDLEERSKVIEWSINPANVLSDNDEWSIEAYTDTIVILTQKDANPIGQILWKVPSEVFSYQGPGRLAFSAEIEILNVAYRGYATLFIRDGLENKHNKHWVANGSPSWRDDQQKTITIPVPLQHFETPVVGVQIYGREPRDGFKVTISNPNLIVVEETPDPDAKILSYIAVISLFISAALLLWLSRQKATNNSRLYQINVLSTGLVALLSVACLETFPILSNHLRADSWSYGIIAKSLANGLGLNASGHMDLSTYPAVPIFYAIFYVLFSDSYISVFWANSFSIFFIWIILTYLDGKFCSLRAITSLILLCCLQSLWTNHSWTLSENVASLFLVLSIFLAQNNSRFVEPIKLHLNNILLGLSVGMLILSRTEFYAFIPLFIFAVAFFSPKPATTYLVPFICCVGGLILLWTGYQHWNAPSNPGFWDKDITRIFWAVEKYGAVQEQNAFDTVLKFFENTKLIVMRPYVEYVVEVPYRRHSQFINLSHDLFIWLFGSGIVFAVIYKRLDAFKAMLLAIIVYRQLIISGLSDSPRYFIPSIYLCLIFILLVADDIKEITKGAIWKKSE